MNLIDFTKNGGFRFKQYTLRLMQEAYFQLLKAFVAFCNIPETGNYIISGLTISGANITAGYVYIDGELCRFEQTAGTLTTKIKKNIVIENSAFKNGSNEPVFRKVYAIVHATDGVALSTFVRVSPVFDANYVHTDNNYSVAEKTKLGGIATGAEVNVQADWNATSGDSFIQNKPIIPVVLKAATSVYLGDFPNDTTAATPITFPDLGTDEYIVLGSFQSLSVLGDAAEDLLVWFTTLHTSTGFTLGAFEPFGGTQNVRFNYTIIAL